MKDARAIISASLTRGDRSVESYEDEDDEYEIGPAWDDPMSEEQDDSFYMGIGRTRDDRYIVIGLDSTVSNEYRYAPAADPSRFVVLAPRERDVEYDADHHGGRWVIRTNADGATNFKLVTAPSDALDTIRAYFASTPCVA